MLHFSTILPHNIRLALLFEDFLPRFTIYFIYGLLKLLNVFYFLLSFATHNLTTSSVHINAFGVKHLAHEMVLFIWYRTYAHRFTDFCHL